MKRPSFQFYPGDWLNDAGLRMCSIGARGLWMDMICLMHQGSEYGHLKVNHKVILPANLARMVGITLVECEGYLSELKEAGVYSVDEAGCIYSRRMIRDEEIRQARAQGGKKGGNPHLLGQKGQKTTRFDNESLFPDDDGKDNQKVNLSPNLRPTPSSSSSSSNINRERENKAPRKKAAPIKWDEEAKDFVLNRDHLDRLTTLYPEIDLPVELAKAADWIDRNDASTRPDYAPFIRTWMGKAMKSNRKGIHHGQSRTDQRREFATALVQPSAPVFDAEDIGVTITSHRPHL